MRNNEKKNNTWANKTSRNEKEKKCLLRPRLYNQLSCNAGHLQFFSAFSSLRAEALLCTRSASTFLMMGCLSGKRKSIRGGAGFRNMSVIEKIWAVVRRAVSASMPNTSARTTKMNVRERACGRPKLDEHRLIKDP